MFKLNKKNLISLTSENFLIFKIMQDNRYIKHTLNIEKENTSILKLKLVPKPLTCILNNIRYALRIKNNSFLSKIKVSMVSYVLWYKFFIFIVRESYNGYRTLRPVLRCEYLLLLFSLKVSKSTMRI